LFCIINEKVDYFDPFREHELIFLAGSERDYFFEKCHKGNLNQRDRTDYYLVFISEARDAKKIVDIIKKDLEEYL